jgi:hypothetical protein
MWSLVASQDDEATPYLSRTTNAQADVGDEPKNETAESQGKDKETANVLPAVAASSAPKKTPEKPPARMIIGLKAAAEFCRMTEANFRKQRSVWPIAGEVEKYEKNKPAWPEDRLEMWSLERMENRRTGLTEERSA